MSFNHQMDVVTHRQPFFDFLDHFVDQPVCDRWKFIVSKELRRWKKLDPYDLWTKSAVGATKSHPFKGNDFKQVLTEYGIESLANQSVHVAGFGHAAPHFIECPLKDSLLGDSCPLEGLVIVDAKKLIFCFTHEGDIQVFDSRPN